MVASEKHLIHCVVCRSGTQSRSGSPTFANSATTTNSTTMEVPHACEIRLAFPTAQHAEQTRRVMEVDQEIGNRVTKSFSMDKEAPNTVIV